MNWFRSSRWAVAGVASAALVAWLFAANHCLVVGLYAQAKASAHACCHDETPTQAPMKSSMSCCSTLNADVAVALHAPAHEGDGLSGTWTAVAEIPGLTSLHPSLLLPVSTGPPSISICTAIDCRKSVPAHAPPGFVA